MCGRFACHATEAEILKTFQVQVSKVTPERSYNIAPSQKVLAIVQNQRGTRGLVHLNWGLIPSWTKSLDKANKPINTRSETAHEKPSFREALRKRRCLIIASGFYEWKKNSQDPFYIQCRDQSLFAMAGLYEFWSEPNGARLDTCSILTTAANQTLAEIHHRMPVILSPKDQAQWLDKAIQDPAMLHPLLKAYPAEQCTYYPVSQTVNKVSQNSPECLAAQEHPTYTVQRSFFD